MPERYRCSGIRKDQASASMPFSVNENAHVQACCGKQEIVRQYPKPVADVQGRKQRRNAGGDVEIGECDIENPGQPDDSRHQSTGVAGHSLGAAELCWFSCGICEHHAAGAVLGGKPRAYGLRRRIAVIVLTVSRN